MDTKWTDGALRFFLGGSVIVFCALITLFALFAAELTANRPAGAHDIAPHLSAAEERAHALSTQIEDLRLETKQLKQLLLTLMYMHNGSSPVLEEWLFGTPEELLPYGSPDSTLASSPLADSRVVSVYRPAGCVGAVALLPAGETADTSQGVEVSV